MSATGLYSGIYAQLRDFGELLDEVLMELKGGMGNQSKVDLLASRFEEMGECGTAGLRAQILRAVLQERMDKSPRYWEKLGHRLRNGISDNELVAELERTAANLEHKRAEVFAKMRG